MKGKIDKDGVLHIERAGVMRQQWCPQSGGHCGDWCPHFGEPKYDRGREATVIDICSGKRLVFDEFTDERVQ